jgi:DNA repair protein RadC
MSKTSKPEQFALPLEPDETRRPDLAADERALIQQAIACLEARYHVRQEALTSPRDTRDYLKLRLAGVPYEVVAVLLLDNRHRVLQYRELFRGTVDGASVRPREVLRLVLSANAAAVILAHNHRPERSGGAITGGPAHHAAVEGCAGPDGRAGTGSHRRRRRTWRVIRGAWADLTRGTGIGE